MTRPDWIALAAEGPHPTAWAMAADGTVQERIADAARDAWASEDLLVLACGLDGAHRAVPCTPLPDRIAAEEREGHVLHSIPSLSQTRPAALSLGAETAIAGFLSLNPGFDGVICHPGRQTIWAQISAGEVVSFLPAASARLIETFAPEAGEDWDEAAFGEALSATMSRPESLAVRLASLGAEATLSGLTGTEMAARCEGTVIGAELAAAKPYWLGMPVALVGAARACRPYAAGLEAQGVTPMRSQGEACLLAGFRKARERI